MELTLGFRKNSRWLRCGEWAGWVGHGCAAWMLGQGRGVVGVRVGRSGNQDRLGRVGRIGCWIDGRGRGRAEPLRALDFSAEVLGI